MQSDTVWCSLLGAVCFLTGSSFILHRVIPVFSDVGYTRRKGNLLYRGYNPAMKNKRSARMRTDAVRKMLTCLCETRHVNPHPARKTRERVLNLLRGLIKEKSHHDHLVFEVAGVDLHLVVAVFDPSGHSCLVLVRGLHIVLCAIGRDQKNRHPAFVDRFVENSHFVLCPGCHGLFLLIWFPLRMIVIFSLSVGMNGLMFFPIRFSLDLSIY